MKLTSFDKMIERTCTSIKNVRLFRELDQKSGNSGMPPDAVANENIVLAITEHGGHLGYFEGMAAKSMWWVRAVDEFLTVLNSSSIIQKKKEAHSASLNGHSDASFVDEGPYVVAKDGLVATTNDKPTLNIEDTVSDSDSSNPIGEITSLLDFKHVSYDAIAIASA